MPYTIRLINNKNHKDSKLQIIKSIASLKEKELTKMCNNKFKCRFIKFYLEDLTQLTDGKFDPLIKRLSMTQIPDIYCCMNEKPNIIKKISNTNYILSKVFNETYVENDAIKQLKYVAEKYTSCVIAAGMPDLHPGVGFPIGFACVLDDQIAPPLIGSDIGCGMSFYTTGVKIGKKLPISFELESDFKNEKFAKKRNLVMESISQLGTVGGGNHFAELQVIQEIKHELHAKKLGLNINEHYLMVHSGSRSFGSNIYDKFKSCMFDADTQEANDYMNLHNQGLEWAQSNRDLIALKFLDKISTLKGVEYEMDTIYKRRIISIFHNFIEKKKFKTIKNKELFIRRKGAAPGNIEYVILPGSRGDYSYSVRPINQEENEKFNAYTLSHGAGRRMARSKTEEYAITKYGKKADFTKTSLGSKVICSNVDLLRKEIPEAYKDIGLVIKDLVDFKLIEVIAIMKPVLTYKYNKPEII